MSDDGRTDRHMRWMPLGGLGSEYQPWGHADWEPTELWPPQWSPQRRAAGVSLRGHWAGWLLQWTLPPSSCSGSSPGHSPPADRNGRQLISWAQSETQVVPLGPPPPHPQPVPGPPGHSWEPYCRTLGQTASASHTLRACWTAATVLRSSQMQGRHRTRQRGADRPQPEAPHRGHFPASSLLLDRPWLWLRLPLGPPPVLQPESR